MCVSQPLRLDLFANPGGIFRVRSPRRAPHPDRQPRMRSGPLSDFSPGTMHAGPGIRGTENRLGARGRSPACQVRSVGGDDSAVCSAHASTVSPRDRERARVPPHGTSHEIAGKRAARCAGLETSRRPVRSAADVRDSVRPRARVKRRPKRRTVSSQPSLLMRIARGSEQDDRKSADAIFLRHWRLERSAHFPEVPGEQPEPVPDPVLSVVVVFAGDRIVSAEKRPDSPSRVSVSARRHAWRGSRIPHRSGRPPRGRRSAGAGRGDGSRTPGTPAIRSLS